MLIDGGEVINITTVDADEDGLSDWWEQEIIDADLNDTIDILEDVLPGGDFDEDGISNLDEFEEGTDPVDADDPPLFAAFTAESALGVSLQVEFMDQSIGTITSWQWDFDNDTVIDSVEPNPVWAYDTAGTYSVVLTISDGGRESIASVSVTVNPPSGGVVIHSKTVVGTATTLEGNQGGDPQRTLFSLQMVDLGVHVGTVTALNANVLTDADA
ncbi:MAG: PKD domain-containing protein, partial [Deltaproteobacteria bacterium]|nr:PKD domain-containing protein [Deltaproteobacteria bacterium]